MTLHPVDNEYDIDNDNIYHLNWRVKGPPKLGLRGKVHLIIKASVILHLKLLSLGAVIGNPRG